MSTYKPIFTHKIISKALWDNDIHTIQNEKKIVVILHIYVTRAIYLLFYDDQDIESVDETLFQCGLEYQ